MDAPPLAVLARRFRIGDECWPWTGYVHGQGNKGYGRVQYQGRTYYGHRAMYAWFYGAVPPGMNVLHRCDNPICVRPDHLFVGTQADNIRDATVKGRMRGQDLAVCKNGHPLVRLKNGKQRGCPICMRAYWREYNRTRR